MHLLVVSKYKSESCWQLRKTVSKGLLKPPRVLNKSMQKIQWWNQVTSPFSRFSPDFTLHHWTTTVSQNVQRRLNSHMTWVHQQTPLVPPSTDAVGKWRLKFIPFSFGFHHAASILQSSGFANAINCYHYLTKPSILRYHFSFILQIIVPNHLKWSI